jgi:hypothetical protein
MVLEDILTEVEAQADLRNAEVVATVETRLRRRELWDRMPKRTDMSGCQRLESKMQYVSLKKRLFWTKRAIEEASDRLDRGVMAMIERERLCLIVEVARARATYRSCECTCGDQCRGKNVWDKVGPNTATGLIGGGRADGWGRQSSEFQEPRDGLVGD